MLILSITVVAQLITILLLNFVNTFASNSDINITTINNNNNYDKTHNNFQNKLTIR